MKEIASSLHSITRAHGGSHFEFASTPAQAEAIWEGRKAALWSVLALKPDARVWTTDICVPISKIPKMIRDTEEDARQRGLLACHFGHVVRAPDFVQSFE